MGRFLEFAELLEDKIRREIHLGEGQFPSENASAHSKTETNLVDNSPVGLAWLLGELERKAPPQVKLSSNGKRAYGVTARPPRPRKPHVLTSEQSVAFEFFRRDNTDFNPAFSHRELKLAFRTSALRHHPDRGGTPENFQSVTAAYQTLSQIFKA